MDDQLLTVSEAAQKLHTSPDWLYRHWKHLPFTVRLSPKQLRFSSKGIERYIEEKTSGGRDIQTGEDLVDSVLS
jgi:predicted DNA-binding transcriptional regulator AlpA